MTPTMAFIDYVNVLTITEAIGVDEIQSRLPRYQDCKDVKH